MIGRCVVADVGGRVGGRGPGLLLVVVAVGPGALGVARLPGLQGQPLRLLCQNARRLEEESLEETLGVGRERHALRSV